MLNIVAISFRQYAERAIGYNSYGSFFCVNSSRFFNFSKYKAI